MATEHLDTHEPADFMTLNHAKASFDAVYNAPDPRFYAETLQELDYVIPGEAKPVFQSMISAVRAQRRADIVSILDLGCSYGINAALLKYDLGIDALFGHWTQPRLAAASPNDIRRFDQRYFDSLGKHRDIELIGFDSADQAVDYAIEAGILDQGFSDNLEEREASPELSEVLTSVDLVLSTGCVGYVTERTFERIVRAAEADGAPPWVASFVLRMFPYDAIAETLAAFGLVTEKLEGRSFVQRRFANDEEMKNVIDSLESQGIDAGGLEREGFLYAEFFLSRLSSEAAARPLCRLIGRPDGR